MTPPFKLVAAEYNVSGKKTISVYFVLLSDCVMCVCARVLYVHACVCMCGVSVSMHGM